MVLSTPFWTCDNSAPMAYLDASVSRIKVASGSGYAKHGADVSASFNLLNARSWSSIQWNSAFPVSLYKHRAISA